MCMGMQDIIDIFVKEWPTLQHALVSVITIALLCLGTGWSLGRFMYGQRIEDMASSLKLSDRQIADYKDKLNGATPDEIKGRIQMLEGELNRLRPPSLTAVQVEAARNAIAKYVPAGVKFATDIAGIDNSRIPVQLKAILSEAKWPVIDGIAFTVEDPAPSGIFLTLSEAEPHHSAGLAIKAMLDAANVSYSIYKHAAAKSDQMAEIVFTHRD